MATKTREGAGADLFEKNDDVVNLNEVSDEAGFPELPPATYPVLCEEYKYAPNSKGNMMASLRLKITGPAEGSRSEFDDDNSGAYDPTNRKLFMNFVVAGDVKDDTGLRLFKKALRAFNPDIDPETMAKFSFNRGAPLFVGKTARAKTKNRRDNNNEIQADVKDLLPAEGDSFLDLSG